MKLLVRALILAVFGIVLVGCTIREATFSRYVFVNTLYLYVDQNHWHVIAEIAKPIAEPGQDPKAGILGAVGVLTAEGREPAEALYNLQRAAGKRLFLGKLEAVIMRTADLEKMREWFDVMLTHPEIRGNIPLFAMDVVDRSMIVEANSRIPEPSRQLRNLTRNSELGDIVRETFVYRLSMHLRQPWQALFIPGLRFAPDGSAHNLPFHTDGLRLVSTHEQVSVGAEDVPMILLATGMRFKGPMTVDLNSGESWTFEVMDNVRKVKVNWRDGKPEIEARLTLTVAPHSHLHNTGGGELTILSKQVTQAFQGELRKLTEDAQKRWSLDPFRFGEEVRKRTKPEVWEAVSWDNLWPMTKVTWQVQLRIANLSGPIEP